MRPTFSTSTFRHSLASSRTTLRANRSRFTQQRFSSSTPGSSNSTDAAQKKAQEALASASKNATQLWESARTKVLEPVGQAVGKMLGSYKQPILYNLAVGRELAKLVYRAEGLQPPSLNTIQSVYASIWSSASNVQFWRNSVASGEIARLGVYGLQAYGIFKIGEIVGRRSLIGYNLH
ncbi:hypothetical protein BDN72DRAFT_846741 [Pluteus cervinus]|uniref:Uncharacterized protein n=1 Tax=Pluteus cervinus TaxID=181527 RepID=A0ACD3AFF0_9AGAR|nr:hypothetical protein BDN72DRAFT_846741 [Pluteus cervinus]